MSIRRYLPALLASALGIVAAPRGQAEWTFQGLGTLGGDYTSANALSRDGSVVVGRSRNADGHSRAFRWQAGAMAPIGDPTHTSPTGVSADGSVVVINPGGRAPCRWEDGVLLELPVGPATTAWGTDVSADGSIVVGQASTIPDPFEPLFSVDAAVWGPPDEQGAYGLRTLKSLTPLPLPPGEGQDSAYGVSADGSLIVGMSQDPSGNFQGVRWKNVGWSGEIFLLGTLGGLRSGARDVSADGSVIVGWAERADGLREAFRWENDTMVGLGTLRGDWLASFANAVSADGSVVVGYAQNAQSETEPFVWDQAHGIRSLTELLTQNGIDVSDWDLGAAVDISADGRVIVGTGYHISAGRTEGWIATIPEPSTLVGLLTMGGALLLAQLWRRRRRLWRRGM